MRLREQSYINMADTNFEQKGGKYPLYDELFETARKNKNRCVPADLAKHINSISRSADKKEHYQEILALLIHYERTLAPSSMRKIPKGTREISKGAAVRLNVAQMPVLLQKILDAYVDKYVEPYD